MEEADGQLMSSEDSEEERSGHSKILIKRPLPFRSEKVDVFFRKLDDLTANEKKTTSFNRRPIPRKIGPPSGRTLWKNNFLHGHLSKCINLFTLFLPCICYFYIDFHFEIKFR